MINRNGSGRRMVIKGGKGENGAAGRRRGKREGKGRGV